MKSVKDSNLSSFVALGAVIRKRANFKASLWNSPTAHLDQWGFLCFFKKCFLAKANVPKTKSKRHSPSTGNPVWPQSVTDYHPESKCKHSSDLCWPLSSSSILPSHLSPRRPKDLQIQKSKSPGHNGGGKIQFLPSGACSPQYFPVFPQAAWEVGVTVNPILQRRTRKLQGSLACPTSLLVGGGIRTHIQVFLLKAFCQAVNADAEV